MILFYQGLAAGLGLDVSSHEPLIAPLGLQGSRADELAARIWGEQVKDIRFFRHTRVDVKGMPMALARSGYSVQGGYELYFEGVTGGDALCVQLMEAGKDLDIRAGCPCQAERVEAGLGRLCEMERDPGCLGWAALQEKQTPSRQMRPVEIADGPLPPQGNFRSAIAGGKAVGRVSSSFRAHDFGCNAATGLTDASHWAPGTELTVHTAEGPRDAVDRAEFWGR